MVLVACGGPDEFETGSPFSGGVPPGAEGEGEGDPTETADEPPGGTGGDAQTGSATDADDTDGDPTGDDPPNGETGDPGDPSCYTEPLFPDADVSDIVNSYGGAGWKDDLIEAMDRRWPAGAWLLQEQYNDSYFGQFSDPNSWTGMVGWLDTLLHEETHLFNAYHAIAVGQNHALYFHEDLILYLPPEQGFPRSEIYSELIPEAQAGIYAPTYLTGDQGQRGFNPLLDETLAYVNEVPGLSVFGEYFQGGVSLRDGAAAFLYFIEVYLRVARTDHPDFYAWAQSQDVYVQAVRTAWLRTYFFYEEVADGYPGLGISDGIYRAAATTPENLAEIEMFIGQPVDASSCLP